MLEREKEDQKTEKNPCLKLTELHARVALLDAGGCPRVTVARGHAVHDAGANGDGRHDLNTASDHHIVHARHDGLCRKVEGLQRRATLTFHRSAGHGLGPLGGQHAVASDIAGLGTHLREAAKDHVVHKRRIDASALLERLQHDSTQFHGVPL